MAPLPLFEEDFQNQLVQRQVQDSTAKPLVLLLLFLQAFQLIGLHASIVLAPAIERHFAHANLADRVRDRAALAMQDVNLTQLRDDRFRLVASL